LLNVGYIVAAPGSQIPQGVKLIHSSDLDVWERETVWPRAFFVNRVLAVHEPSGILKNLANSSHAPFAAVESQFIPKWMPENVTVDDTIIPARHYALTNNRTNFSIDATGPGLIVLSETFYPGDFIASLNDMRVDYIRVNNAFKGIWVKEAGKYDVSFTYRPEKLNLAIMISLIGLLLVFILSVILSNSEYVKSGKKC